MAWRGCLRSTSLMHSLSLVGVPLAQSAGRPLSFSLFPPSPWLLLGVLLWISLYDAHNVCGGYVVSWLAIVNHYMTVFKFSLPFGVVTSQWYFSTKAVKTQSTFLLCGLKNPKQSSFLWGRRSNDTPCLLKGFKWPLNYKVTLGPTDRHWSS